MGSDAGIEKSGFLEEGKGGARGTDVKIGCDATD